MIMSKYLQLYERLDHGPVATLTPFEADSIAREMRGMIRAKTNRAAVDALRPCWIWDSDQQAIAFVVKARKLWARMK